MHWRSQIKRTTVLFIYSVGVLLIGAPLAFAEKPKEASFRRIYGPEKWISRLGLINYQTMESDRFERIAKSLRLNLPLDIERGVYVRQAEYTVTLLDKESIQGTAVLDFQFNRQTGTTEFDCGEKLLAISNPHWSSGRTAKLGVSNESRNVLLVDRSDQLRFAWSEHGESLERNESLFNLQFPPARSNRITIDTSADQKLIVDHGILQHQRNGDQIQWTIDLGLKRRLQLRVQEVGLNSQSLFASQTSNYRFRERGAEFSSTIQFDGNASQFELELDRDIEPTQITINDTPIRWTSTLSAMGEFRFITIPNVTRPQNARDALDSNDTESSTISISGITRSRIGTWSRLPRVRARNAVVLQNRLRVSVARPLTLFDLRLQGCLQTNVSVGADELQERTIQMMDAKSGSVELLLGRQPFEFGTISGIEIGLAESKATATVNTRLYAKRGSTFRVSADVLAGWRVQDVFMTTPTEEEMLEGWSVRQGVLTVDLTRAVSRSDSDVILTTLLEKPFNLANPVPVQDLQPLDFRQALEDYKMMTVSSTPPVQFQWRDDGYATWLPVSQLSIDESKLFSTLENDRVLSLDSSTNLSIESAESQSVFRTAIEIIYDIAPKTIRQAVNIEITPDASTVSRVSVRTSQDATGIQWHLYPKESAAKIPIQPDNTNGDGTAWEFLLPTPQAGEFSIVGEHHSSAENKGFVANLVRIEKCESQTAQIEIRSKSKNQIVISTTGALHEIPPNPDPDLDWALDNEPLIRRRRRFRYSPDANVGANLESSLSVRLTEDQGTPLTSIWRVQPTTTIDHQGVATHLITVFVENFGSSELQAKVPDWVDVDRTEVDDQPVKYNNDMPGVITIPIPVERRHCVVKISLKPTDTEKGWLTWQCQCPEIGFDAPILQRTWHVWLSPGMSYRGNMPIARARHPSSVISRFFGPFSRSWDVAPFNFFSEQSWFNLVRSPNLSETKENVQRFIDALNNVRNEEALEKTWGEVIKQFAYESRVSRSRFLISPYVDHDSLALRGILPTTPFPQKRDGLNSNPLQDLEIAILAVDRRIIITTIDSLSLFEGDTIPADNVRIAYLRSDRDDRNDILTERLGTLLNADDWLKSDSERRWVDRPSDQEPKLLCGWTLVQLNPDQKGVQIRFFNQQSLWRIAGVAFLIATGLAWRITAVSGRYATVLICICAAICLAMPESISILGTSIFWGTIAGAFFHWLRVRLPKQKLSTTMITRTAAMVIALFVLCGFGHQHGFAQEPAKRLYDVYIPTDDDGKPLESYVRMPLELFREMIRVEAHLAGRSAKWMITNANYRIELQSMSDDPPSTGIVFAEYEMEILSSEQFVQIKLPAASMGHLTDTVMLNGREVPLQKDQEASTIQFPIWNAGTHQIQLRFDIAIQAVSTSFQLSLPIIRVPDSRLTIQPSLDMNELQIDAIHGPIRRESEIISANIGAADEITIRWLNEKQSITSRSQIDQYTWMHIHDDEVTISNRFKITMPTEETFEFSFIADAALEHLRNNQDIRLTSENKLSSKDTKYSYIVIPDQNGQAVVDMEFRYSGVTGLGGIRFPKIKLDDHTTHSHFLAVSDGTNISATPQSANSFGIRPIPVSRFSGFWESLDDKPSLAYEVFQDDFEAVFFASHIENDMRSRLDSYYFIASDRIQVATVIAIDPSTEDVFRQLLHVDPRLVITDISIKTDAGDLPVSWVRRPDGMIAVLFHESGDMPFQLIIAASMVFDSNLVVLPNISIEQVEQERCVLFRATNVAIDPSVSEEFVESFDNETDVPRDWTTNGVYHSAWAKNESDAELSVSVQEYQPEFDAELFLSISQTDTQWTYRIECRLKSIQQAIDSIRLRIPAGFGQPSLNGLAGTVDVQLSARPNQQQLVISPLQPMESPTTFFLEGPLQESILDEAFDVSLILQKKTQPETLVCLPIPDDSWDWRIVGLDSIADPKSLPQGISADTHHFFRVATRHPNIRRFQSTSISERCHVEQVTHHVWLDGDSSRTMTHFDVTARAASQLVVMIPDGVRLRQVVVNGTCFPIVQRHQPQKINLPGSDANQAVRIIWEFEKRVDDSTINRLMAPSLKYFDSAEKNELFVERSIWRLVEDHPDKRRRVLRWYPDAPNPPPEFVNPGHANEPRAEDFWGTTAHYFFSEDNPELIVLDTNNTYPSSNQMRYLLAVGIAIGGCVVACQTKLKTNLETHLWIYAVAVLFGLGWWLFLQPSVLGWAIVVIAIIVSWLVR